MRLTAVFVRIRHAVVDYCALQRAMAERASELEMRAWEELERQQLTAEKGASPTVWDEWDKRYMS